MVVDDSLLAIFDDIDASTLVVDNNNSEAAIIDELASDSVIDNGVVDKETISGFVCSLSVIYEALLTACVSVVPWFMVSVVVVGESDAVVAAVRIVAKFELLSEEWSTTTSVVEYCSWAITSSDTTKRIVKFRFCKRTYTISMNRADKRGNYRTGDMACAFSAPLIWSTDHINWQQKKITTLTLIQYTSKVFCKRLFFVNRPV